MGEDAAYFAVEEQSTGKWAFFTAELAIVLAILYVVRLFTESVHYSKDVCVWQHVTATPGQVCHACEGVCTIWRFRREPHSESLQMQVWIAPGTGLANNFLGELQSVSSDSTVLMMTIFAVFAIVHSGLAYLRPSGRGRPLHLRQCIRQCWCLPTPFKSDVHQGSASGAACTDHAHTHYCTPVLRQHVCSLMELWVMQERS